MDPKKKKKYNKCNNINHSNLIHTSPLLFPDPPGGNFFIVSSWTRAGLGRIKYKAKATTTQIPVNKMKLVSSLLDANGPSNLCTNTNLII